MALGSFALMKNNQTSDVLVIGAGVFGSWTAYRLAQSGRSVTLLDAYGAGNSRSSSGGESRIIRMSYGPDDIYTLSAKRSLDYWQELSNTLAFPIFYRTGVLLLSRNDDNYSQDTLATLSSAGVPHEKLTANELTRRYPQFSLTGIDWGLLEPESGVLLARQSVGAVVAEAVRHGVDFAVGSVLPPVSTGNTLKSIQTLLGQEIYADEFVFACGPWLPKIFPTLLGQLIHVTRQEELFFGVPAGDGSFSWEQMPTWIDFNELVYGMPDIQSRGAKLAIDEHGPAFDPDTGERTVSESGLARGRKYLSKRFPALASAPLSESRVCQYENTSNGDFLIDRHPDFENVWLVGGGSGHGFKHGPMVGQYVTSLITGQGTKIEPRFSLASKSTVQRRAVF
jgi:monomeric sarcosine oxidase